LAALTFNKTVTVDWRKKHRERLVGKVTVNGVDANLEQVKAGMAWWYREYAKEQSPTDRRLYELAEQQAKAQRVGLWREAAPIPPWEWRHGTGAAVKVDCACGSGVTCTGAKGGHYCTTENGGKSYR